MNLKLSPAAGRLPQAAPFLVLTVIGAVFVFVGMNASGYSIDELFTLFVIDHDGGLAEVLRRALTDTHPPAYYMILYGWTHLFGTSETAVRLFSALCAAAMLVVLFKGLRPALGLPARSFAVAVGAASSYVFEYGQMARSYALCGLLAAGLIALALAARRADRAERPVPLPVCAGLFAVGLLACFTHFYSFLTVGAVLLVLLAAVRQPGFRIFVLAAGLFMLAAEALYARSLLAHTAQDVHNMWFSNAAMDLARQAFSAFAKSYSGLTIGAAAILAWLAGRTRRRPPAEGAPDAFLPALCGSVWVLVTVGGLVVSFVVAPSFGKRNLLVLSPFLWALAGWLYERAASGRRLPALLSGFLVLAVAVNLLLLPYRFRPINEPWRESAHVVDSFPACADAEIPVVLPYVFGPSTPFFRTLAERHFFGRYAAHPERLHAYLPAELASPRYAATLADHARPGACPILLWAAHDVTPKQAAGFTALLAARPELAGRTLRTTTFHFWKAGSVGLAKRKANIWLYTLAPQS